VRKTAAGDMNRFGATAKSLSRNPLGIIALFIVLVYGFACLVTAFSGSFTPGQKIPLIYFLVIFPVLVLGIFTWLVIQHSGKLFAPGDYKDEANYVAIASLAVASSRGGSSTLEPQIRKIVEAVQDVRPAETSSDWNHRLLWVDDRPENNVYERQAFEAVGIVCSLALSTAEALDLLSKKRYAAIISDMGRREGTQEGYVLLDAIRQKGDKTPFFIYAGSNEPAHKRQTVEHGGQGCTNSPQDLFQMVTRAVLNPSH
jgi:CheY-like chemotaxis protein